ncbi:putative leucine-rich repeat domain superfamily [Helianthus annuus]|nr:putative leucine-rich repeat domain superfamily [Helianthus annuus]
MRGWKKWSRAVFPCLQKLEIRDCPNLVEVTLEALPSLNVLILRTCDSGVLRRLVEVASAVTKLEIRDISGLNDEVWGGVIEYLGAVEELVILECNEIRYLVKSDADASKILVKLRKLEVWECDNMVSCSCPDGIEELDFHNCSSIEVVWFPKGGQEKLRSLRIWNGRNLLEKEWEWRGQKMNRRSSMPMLEHLRIYNWPNLKSIIELNCLVHLTTLIIYDCENLESFPDTLTSLKKLKTLGVSKCPKLDVCFLPGWVWPPTLQILIIGKLKKPFSEWGPQTLPTSLVGLSLYGDGEDGAGSCSQFSHILPSSLPSLEIHEFEKLESFSVELQHLQSLSFFNCPNLKKVCSQPQHLTSLHHLTFLYCPKMMDLPELLLPSLLRLRIWGDCPVKERCSKKGSYWPLISHIPCLDI